MPSVLDLPNELLQEIAGYLPYSDYANLVRVNRRLRQCCHGQRSILLRVARDALRNAPGAAIRLVDAYSKMPNEDLPSVQLESPEMVVALNNASLSALERMACVAERCAIGDIKRWTRNENNDLWDWLPHMLALQYPSSLAWSPAHFLEVQGACGGRLPESRPSIMNRMLRVVSTENTTSQEEEEILRKAEFLSVTFVLIYATLQCIELNMDDLNVAFLFDEAFLMNRLVSVDHIEQGKQPPADLKELKRIRDQLQALVPAYGMLTRDFDLVQGTALIPVLIYELVIQFHDAHLVQLPKPRNIPFTSFMDIPEVLNGNAVAFSQCHVATSTSCEFLAGSWMGYYSDQRIRSHHFDPPMKDIIIIARPEITQENEDSEAVEWQGSGNRIKTVIDPVSNGIDRVGHFTLHGTVAADGMVNITKHYAHAGWTWSWYGRVTPFGIVGVWGNAHYFGGYFWIWKKDWC